jgi:hypothetical protein
MRKLLPILLITCVAFIGLASAPPLSETGKNTVAVIQGFVYDSATNVGLEGVVVSAADISVSTDTTGFYSLVIEPGYYDILYIKEGWFTHIIPSLAVADTLTIDVVLQYSFLDFPFSEDWSSGDFETNGWTFEPTIGNWLINTDAGNPAPSAEFNFSPLVSNYSYALISPQIDARSITENLMLNFDIYLFNSYLTGTEKLRVDIWNGSEWCEIDEFSNSTHLLWTRKVIDVTQFAAGQFTKVRFVAYGQNSINIENWRIDNIHFDLVPSIALSNSFFWAILNPPWGLITWHLDIFNHGEGTLNYNIIVEFPYSVLQGEGTTRQGMESSLDPNQRPVGDTVPTKQENEVTLNYDGHNFDAIGLTSGGTFHVAARFPSSMVEQYAGYILESVNVYVNNLPTNLVLKILGAGTATNPGQLLHQQSINPMAQSWNTINLNSDVILDGTDLWVGYTVSNAAGFRPAGVDAGPANPNGDWISLNGTSWEHLAGYGLNYNWNIRAKIKPHVPPWLIVEPAFGSISAGDYKRVLVIADPMKLGIGGHFAYIKIYSNDPLNPVKLVMVELSIDTSIEDIHLRGYLSCYPIPASSILYIEFNPNIRDFKIIDPMGQVALGWKVEDEESSSVDVSHLPNGIYFLQAEAKDGKVYSRKIVISR